MTYIFTFTEISIHYKKFMKFTGLIDDLIIHDYVNSWNKNLYKKKLIKDSA